MLLFVILDDEFLRLLVCACLSFNKVMYARLSFFNYPLSHYYYLIQLQVCSHGERRERWERLKSEECGRWEMGEIEE